jgi:hypothetical protein
MSEVGKTISDALAFVSRAGGECDALANLIKQEISDLFHQGPLGSRYRAQQWSSSYRMNDNGWICTDVAWSLPLVPKGKFKVAAHLGFQISLLCTDAEAGSSPEPLLHINFWEPPTHLKSDDYMGFPMSGFSDELMSRLAEGSARLFRWEANKGAADWWTYSLRLARLNALEDIRSSIKQPVEALLHDLEAGELLIDSLPTAVDYTAVKGALGYYKVVL